MGARLLSGLVAVSLCAWAQVASELHRLGRQAEKVGEFSQAYLLYAQAAALDPDRREYWARAQSVQTKALSEARLPTAIDVVSPGSDEDSPSMLDSISEKELLEARRPLPPFVLSGSAGSRSFDSKGDSKALFQEVAAAFGLDVVFDGDYQPVANLRLRVEGVDYRGALRTLEAATGSFVVPLGPRLFFVAKDTPQKRTESESTVALVTPIPEPVSIQEAQEMARSVQQAMEIQRFVIDSARRIVLLKDRVSKAWPAQQLFEHLLRHRPQVMVEVELLDLNTKNSRNFGLRLPDRSALIDFGRFRNASPTVPSGFLKFLTFGAGKTFLGLGITDAELFANMTRSTADSLMRATLRSIDGQPASLHVGDKYPVITQGYYGPVEGAGQIYTPPPTFNFEDLGLVLKVIPKIHAEGEVTLEIESEFKVLTGKSLNGIPVISNRKFISKARLRNGEWAVVAGLLSSTEARTLGGIAGLSAIPGLGALVSQHGRDHNTSNTLLVLKPRVIGTPPSEEPAPAIWVGSEARLLTQM